MKLDTLSEEVDRNRSIPSVLLAGALTVAGVAVVGLLVRKILSTVSLQGLEILGQTLLMIATLIGLIWLSGHVVVGLMSETVPRCGCEYEYRFLWTEWWHKRKCLAYTVNPR